MSASIGPSNPKQSILDAVDVAKEGSSNLLVKIDVEDCEVSVSFGFRTHMKSALKMLSNSWRQHKKIVTLFMAGILMAIFEKHPL